MWLGKRLCVAGELEVPSGWSEESEGEVVGCPDHLEQRAESHTWCNQREGKFLVCNVLGPSELFTCLSEKFAIITLSCSLIVSLTLICFSHHILGDPSATNTEQPVPSLLHSKWDLPGLAWDRSHGQFWCPGVMAHILT